MSLVRRRVAAAATLLECESKRRVLKKRFDRAVEVEE